MMLAPCPACRRHLKREEARCPFCAATTAVAVTAIVASVALSACTPQGVANVYGGPPPVPSEPAFVDGGTGGGDDGGAAKTDPARGGDVYGGPPPAPAK